MANAAYALDFPGISGNYASTPDSAALSIVGDIDLRAKVALDDWTPVTNNTLIGKRIDVADRSYTLAIAANGNLQFTWSSNGTSSTGKESTVATGITNGASKWVRATFDVDNGASGNDTKFYTSDDGVIWAQLGTTVTTAGVTSIFDGIAPLQIGSYDGSVNRMTGNVYYAEVRNGIDGGIVAIFDPSEVAPVSAQDPSVFTTGGTPWTILGSAWSWLFLAAGFCPNGYAMVSYGGGLVCAVKSSTVLMKLTSNTEEICRSTCGSTAI